MAPVVFGQGIRQGHFIFPGAGGFPVGSCRHGQYRRCCGGDRYRRPRSGILDVDRRVPGRRDSLCRIGARPDLQGSRRRPVARRARVLLRESARPEMVRVDFRRLDDHRRRPVVTNRAVEQYR